MVSSWAWVRGLAGAMATAGADTGSRKAAVEAIAEAAVTQPIAAILPAAASAVRLAATEPFVQAVRRDPAEAMPCRHAPPTRAHPREQRLMPAPRTRLLRKVAEHAQAAVVVDIPAAANISSLGLPIPMG